MMEISVRGENWSINSMGHRANKKVDRGALDSFLSTGVTELGGTKVI
jgi:hypothetical protein